MASSWLNANHFTSIAKSALTEAQKTIDKALDIEASESDKPAIPSTPTAPPDGPPSTSSRSSSRSSSITSASSEFMRQSVKESSAKLWGSFTGSFFEAPPLLKTAPPPPTTSTESAPPDALPVISAQPAALTDETASVTSTSSAVMTEVSEAEVAVEAASMSVSDAGRLSPAVLSVGEASSDSSALPTPLLSSQEMSVETLKGWEESEEIEVETDEAAVGVTNMMEEAMVDNNSERPSDTSSSKSYEVMKNFSFPTSGQTSGDEFETQATSSDIEVITSATGANGHKGWPSPKRSHNNAQPNVDSVSGG